MKYALPIFLVVFTLAIVGGLRRACDNGDKGFDANALEYEKFQTEHFSIDVPKGWSEKTRRIQGGHGQLKLERETEENVEIVWLGDGTPPEETFEMTRGAIENMGGRVTKQASGARIDLTFHRFAATFKLDGDTSYTAGTTIACTKTDLMVKVWVVAIREGAALGVIDHVMETIECLGDAPIARFDSQPSTSLPDTWGFGFDDGAAMAIVARNDGAATVIVIGTPGDSAQLIIRDFQRAEKFGALELNSEYRQISGAGSSNIGGMTGTLDGEPVGFGLIVCRDISTSFILLAQDSAGDPMALIPKFGCPGTLPRAIDKLPSACTIGLSDYCGEDAEKQLSEKPAELPQ